MPTWKEFSKDQEPVSNKIVSLLADESGYYADFFFLAKVLCRL